MPHFSYLFPSSVETSTNGKVAFRWDGNGGPFGGEASLETNPLQTAVQVMPAAFSESECDRIVELGESGPRVSGEVEKGYGSMRVSDLTWIEPVADSHWLYHRMAQLILRANKAYGFRVTGLQESLQFSRYGVGGRFDWHVDVGGKDTAGRKLSVSVQLSVSSDYEGGDLEFLHNAGRPARDRGTAIVFPAYLSHRVTPVARGLRRTLIAWACGPAFI